MKLFEDNVVIIGGNPYVIVAQSHPRFTIWISDGERVMPLEFHHTSLCRGYVSTKGVVEGYSGKFGTGVTVKDHNSRSSRYCYISYYILSEEANR